MLAPAVADAEQLGGVARGHAQRLLLRHPAVPHHVAHRGGEVERGPGQDAVGGRAPAARHRDASIAQPEARGGAPDGRHGVAHQEGPARRHRPERQLKRGPRHVMAVGDEAAPDPTVGQQRPHRPGLARRRGSHGVPHVGGAGDALVDRAAHLLGRGVGVPGRHADAATHEAGDEAGRHDLRREGHQGRPSRGRGEGGHDGALGRGGHLVAVVRAEAGPAEERPLEVDAEHAVEPLLDGLAHRVAGARHVGRRAADEGDEEVGGAEPAVCGHDPLDGGHGRVVVEQHVATAVDLHVDEAGCHRPPPEVDHAGCHGEGRRAAGGGPRPRRRAPRCCGRAAPRRR